jgi:hypothetical protein
VHAHRERGSPADEPHLAALEEPQQQQLSVLTHAGTVCVCCQSVNSAPRHELWRSRHRMKASGQLLASVSSASGNSPGTRPRLGFEAMEKGNMSFPCREPNPGRQSSLDHCATLLCELWLVKWVRLGPQYRGARSRSILCSKIVPE